MDARWRIELLGWLRATYGDRVVTRFRTHKAGALLAYLAYYGCRSHPRDELVELLWPECDREAGRHRLRMALSSLRHPLEPPGVPPGAVLLADRTSVQLNPAAVATDVAQFEAALQSARRSRSHTERVQLLTEAVAHYRGELLPGYFAEWVLLERQQLAEAFLQALHQLMGCDEQAGDLQRALQWARRAVSADPLREASHREVMRLLAAAGEPEAALRQYQELERLLAAELDATPEMETEALVASLRDRTTGRRGDKAKKQDTPSESRILSPAHSAVSLSPSHPLRPPTNGGGSHDPVAPSGPLPTGTVTFLLTDIERSTALWERTGDTFHEVLASHHALLRRLFREHRGCEIKEMGDAFLVAFPHAGDALGCAIAGQRTLAEHPWPEAVGALRVRMALHTGDVRLQEGDYHGLVLHYAQRLLTAGHGGQILCSEATAALLRRDMEPEVRLAELGVYRLRDVAAPERLFQVEYPEMAQREFPPLSAEAGYTSHLPLQFTRFVGRDDEIARLQEIFLSQMSRLVTLTGPGGTGKTRLALAVGGRLVEWVQGAVWFVPLADLIDPHRIAEAIRDALRLPRAPETEPLEQVVATLARQPAVLLLDNFEHLVEEGAPLVQTLLARVPTLTLLVTSRRRLDLPGEREFPVPPLLTPNGPRTPEQLLQCESVQLFVERAQAVRPDFQVRPANAAAVAELCTRLEGIPLALELAAARAWVLTPAQMLARLDQRFELLTRRQHRGDLRHRSLRATLDWSYQLLSPELQRFFVRLSVFRGGWTLAAAEAVCEEPNALEYLEQLRECSLVVAEETGAEMRFRMLETLREYARTQSGPEELAALKRRAVGYYLSLAEEAYPELTGPEQGEWLDRLEREHDNLRAALQGSVELAACADESLQAEIGLRLGAALSGFWEARGYSAEGREHLAVVLALPAAAPCTPARALALKVAGRLANSQGDRAAALAFYQESLAMARELGDTDCIAAALINLGYLTFVLGEPQTAEPFCQESLAIGRALGNPEVTAWSLYNLGEIARSRGSYGAARSFYDESLALWREEGDRRSISHVLNSLGEMALRQGDSAAARALHEESLVIKRELGDRSGIAKALSALGTVAQSQGDDGTARELYQESLTVYRELGGREGTAWILNSLGGLTLDQGDVVAARAFFAEALVLWRELGDRRWGVGECLERLARLAGRQGQLERAARLTGAAAALLGDNAPPPLPGEQAEQENLLSALQAGLGSGAFTAAWTAGQQMSWEESIAYAAEGATPV